MHMLITSPCFLLTLFQSYNNPTQIFAEDVTEEKGENARLSAFVGAIAVGDLVKSTLGPKGMDKILQSA
jgi:T-complex protein 1 subunit beta